MLLPVIAKIFGVLFVVLVIFVHPSDGKENKKHSNDYNFCFEEAAATYGIHPNLLWAIAYIESRFNPRAINKNKNNTYDYGIMQINSSWYNVLKNDWQYLSDPCYNIKVGAWILSNCIEKHGYNWEAVGCYNARSPEKRKKYSYKIYKVLKKYGAL